MKSHFPHPESLPAGLQARPSQGEFPLNIFTYNRPGPSAPAIWTPQVTAKPAEGEE